MALTGCCGFECGTASGIVGHFSGALPTGASFDSTTKRSGNQALRINTSSASCVVTMLNFGSSTTRSGRIYIRFTTLPTGATTLISVGASGVAYDSASQKIFAAHSAGNGSTGVSVTTGVWIRLDFKFDNTSGSGKVTEVSVDGTACGSATGTGTGSNGIQLGSSGAVTTDFYLDDLAVGDSGDYPIGAGKVEPFVPVSDGTHNIAGTGDFAHGTAGADILNSTTDAFSLIDDVPMPVSITTTDLVNILAPANAGDYVECVIGPAPGISTPTTGPRMVTVLAAIHQASTGSGNMEIRLNDNGSSGTVYTATGVAGVTSIAFKVANFADPPSAATVWNANNDGSDGDFRDLRVRIGSPAAVDANPDQYVDSIMIEAEFADSGNVTTTQTQTGKARIQATITKTQSGVARLQKTISQTTTGLAKIVLTVLATITGKAQIQKTQTATQTGKADIQGTSTKTQQGVSRLQKTATQTQLGKARLQKTILTTQPGVSRIQKTITQLTTGVARLQKSVSRTITGVANIVVVTTTTKTQNGLARVQKTISQLQTGLARLQKAALQTQTGKARIQKTVNAQQTGLARIRSTVAQTILGVAKIIVAGVGTQNQLGKARIQKAATQTQLGKARLQKAAAITQNGLARLQKSVAVLQTGVARLQAAAQRTIQGKARLQKSGIATQPGVSRILAHRTVNITGVARIIAGGTYMPPSGALVVTLNSGETGFDLNNGETFVDLNSGKAFLDLSE